MPDYFSSIPTNERNAPAVAEPIVVSSSVQEIISARPGWFVRHGTLVILGMLCLVLAGMSLIHYPDRLEGAMVLTTDPLPLQLKYPGGGQLISLFVTEGSLVQQGQPIAELENNTGYGNIIRLTAMVDSTLAAMQRTDIGTLETVGQEQLQSLGDGQDMYNRLVDAVAIFTQRQRQGIYTKRTMQLQAQAARYQSLSAVGGREQALIDEELQQADERFLANEKLYAEKVISKQEYYEEAARQRQKKIALEQQRRTGLQNSISIADNNKQVMEVRYEEEASGHTQTAAIREQVRNLQNFIQSWKLRYLLPAPYAGSIHFLRPLQLHEAIAAGEEICAIVPAHYHYIAYVSLPTQGSGKVHAGEEAQLLPDPFPDHEYGYLSGKVTAIAALPRKDNAGFTYRVSIALPDSLVTSYHRRLPFTAEMNGTARIITKDRSLLQRLVAGFANMDR